MKPRIGESSFVAKSAVIIGNVVIGENCGIWENAVIRGDLNEIKIGDGSNIQDCCVIHTSEKYPVKIGKNVSIGHGAIIHGAIIEDDCLIGMNSTILNGARIGKGSLVGANTLVKEEMDVPNNSLVLGVPGKIVKKDEGLVRGIILNAESYRRLAREHKEGKYDSF
jgi:carbonic anhydrase/acetyltransferase-like protein (isoleucine patch superfamily)